MSFIVAKHEISTGKITQKSCKDFEQRLILPFYIVVKNHHINFLSKKKSKM